MLTDPPNTLEERARFVILVRDPNTNEIERSRSHVWSDSQRIFDRFRNNGNRAETKHHAEVSSPRMLCNLVHNVLPKFAEIFMGLNKDVELKFQVM